MITEELKKNHSEALQQINDTLTKIKKSNMSESMKVEYMEKVLKLMEARLSATAELAFTLNNLNISHIKQIDLLNKKLDWVYYDRDCAVYLLMAHNADNPRASEQDKLAFSRATYPERPKHERI